MPDDINVTYILGNETKTVKAKKNQTILEISQSNGIPQTSACGGMGVCTTCMCMIQEGQKNLNDPTEEELNMGLDGEINRLGCQARVEGDITVAL